MAYTSELMEKILTSESAKKAVQRVTHKYGESYAILSIFEALGCVYDEYFKEIENLENEIFPKIATWSIPYWEQSLGITDDGIEDEDIRKQRIINKRQERLPMNPTRLENILSALAEERNVTVKENSGEDKSKFYKNRFEVCVDDTDKLFTPEEVVLLYNEIREKRQSHLVFDLIYQCKGFLELHTGQSSVQRIRQILPRVNIYNDLKNYKYDDLKNYTYFRLLTLGRD